MMGDEYEMNWRLIEDGRGLNQSWQEKVCSIKKNVPNVNFPCFEIIPKIKKTVGKFFKDILKFCKDFWRNLKYDGNPLKQF